MKNQQSLQEREKKQYVPPTIEVITIEMEHNIAAGSGTTNTEGPSVEIWEDGPDGFGDPDEGDVIRTR
ncbi:DUF3742 family protein [Elizabethkingia anophelis]|uniref:DUF3742 family protein n=1 Tax=Elizabethkingia anophelis TaxID=1117645 RepID=UPI0013FD0548|nr:DUF3742 family protein [Elizabethkingia anophelis]